MASESEYILENKFIDQLREMKYEFVNFEDSLIVSDSKSLSNSSLGCNFRSQFEKLNNVALTDAEFRELLIYLNKGDEIDKAKKLRGKYPFQREGEITRHLEFLNIEDFTKNIFQITNQLKVEGTSRNRYDVTILINGLPLIQVELKRRGKNIDEAFNQCVRYKRDSMLGSLLEYIQIFVISDGVDTKYMANSRHLDKKFCFHFTDFENNIIGDLYKFSELFFEHNFTTSMISDYMIICESDDGDERKNMIMRPYQVHAVESIIDSVVNNDVNGYIWHTTGSGKTLTSYKACELISEMDDISKVLFIVDRKDLDSQTIDEYQVFSGVKNKITATTSTRQLKSKLDDKNEKIIITTIQKLDKAIKSFKYERRESYNQKVVLIFDECHRSQLGDMHKYIDLFFESNQKFGFTGTPILRENSQKYMTTSDVFGKQLHKYLINNAISDGNVLGFEVRYEKPVKQNTNISDELIDKPDLAGVFGSDKYKEVVIDNILKTYGRYTKDSFNAMLVCDSITSVVRYYELLRDMDHNLKVACVYSISDNVEIVDGVTRPVEAMSMMIEDYNELFKSDRDKPKYSLDTFAAYKTDVTKRVKKREIDLLIVCDMYLTGFDAKVINTMYFDRYMKYHSLIQAMSRTNRINGVKKDYGKIIFYRDMKDKVDEAIGLFSDPNAPTNILKKEYVEYVEQINDLIKLFNENYESLDFVLNLQSETDRLKFVSDYRDLIRVRSALESFYEFEYSDINMTEQEFVDFASIYKSFVPKVNNSPSESIIDGFDFEMELVCEDVINVDYILELLSKIQKCDNDEELNIEKLRVLEELSTKNIGKSKLEIIKQVIDNYDMQGDIINLYEEYQINYKTLELESIADEYNLDYAKLIELYNKYEFDHKLDSTMIINVCKSKPSLLNRQAFTNEVSERLFNLQMN